MSRFVNFKLRTDILNACGWKASALYTAIWEYLDEHDDLMLYDTDEFGVEWLACRLTSYPLMFPYIINSDTEARRQLDKLERNGYIKTKKMFDKNYSKRWVSVYGKDKEALK